MSVTFKLVWKGGPGSGHWGHAGRPGKRGGSLPGTTTIPMSVAETVMTSLDSGKSKADIARQLARENDYSPEYADYVVDRVGKLTGKKPKAAPSQRSARPPKAREVQSNFNLELVSDPTVEPTGGFSYEVGLLAGGEGHSDDALLDLVTEVLYAGGYPGEGEGADMGWIVELEDVYEVDGTTSVRAFAERA